MNSWSGMHYHTACIYSNASLIPRPNFFAYIRPFFSSLLLHKWEKGLGRRLLKHLQVTLAINAAIVYSSRTVGVGYVHKRLSNTMSMCTIWACSRVNMSSASGVLYCHFVRFLRTDTHTHTHTNWQPYASRVQPTKAWQGHSYPMGNFLNITCRDMYVGVACGC